MAKASIELTLPKLAGTRWAAEEFLLDLPADLSSVPVSIDCTAALSVTQGYMDELCKQILQLRSAQSLTLRGAEEKVVGYALRSAHLRELEAPLIIDLEVL